MIQFISKSKSGRREKRKKSGMQREKGSTPSRIQTILRKPAGREYLLSTLPIASRVQNPGGREVQNFGKSICGENTGAFNDRPPADENRKGERNSFSGEAAALPEKLLKESGRSVIFPVKRIADPLHRNFPPGGFAGIDLLLELTIPGIPFLE